PGRHRPDRWRLRRTLILSDVGAGGDDDAPAGDRRHSSRQVCWVHEEVAGYRPNLERAAPGNGPLEPRSARREGLPAPAYPRPHEDRRRNLGPEAIRAVPANKIPRPHGPRDAALGRP